MRQRQIKLEKQTEKQAERKKERYKEPMEGRVIVKQGALAMLRVSHQASNPGVLLSL